MRIVIVEDEGLAAARLADLLREMDPHIEIAAQLRSIVESVEWFQHNSADLVFLDIQLSDGLSFSIFEHVRVEAPVIFTTAFDEYAMKAFKLNSIDYLLKPVSADALRQSIAKFRSMRHALLPDIERLMESMRGLPKEHRKRFLIQVGEQIKKVETDATAYFYAMEKNVFLTTFQNHTYSIDYTLDNLQEILDPGKFFRINRKMIINFDAIRNMIAFSRSRIKIELNPPAPKNIEALVSVERTPDFRAWIDK